MRFDDCEMLAHISPLSSSLFLFVYFIFQVRRMHLNEVEDVDVGKIEVSKHFRFI
jgi:hypothetical protein